MARRLLEPGHEDVIRDTYAGWKHIDAALALLGERIWYDTPFVPIHVDFKLNGGVILPGQLSVSRPLVSIAVNRFYKPTSWEMGTETCVMHDELLPTRSADEKMDGCRFRDDSVSAIMSAGVGTIPKDTGKHFVASVHDGYFLPLVQDEEHAGLEEPIVDDFKVNTVLRIFSAYPGNAAGMVSNVEIVSNPSTFNRLMSEISAMSGRYAAMGIDRKTRDLQKGLDTVFQSAPGQITKHFSRTADPIIAREVARTIALGYDKQVRRKTTHKWERVHIPKMVNDAVLNHFYSINNPAIGDALARLINEGDKALPESIDRCAMAEYMIAPGKSPILVSDDGKKMAAEFYDKNCKHAKTS
jgi:hypothetical protein